MTSALGDKGINTYKGTVRVARRLRPEEIPPELTERLLDFLR